MVTIAMASVVIPVLFTIISLPGSTLHTFCTYLLNK